MTRKEEIYNALKELNIGWYNEDTQSIGDDTYCGQDLQDAFQAGVQWADSHPKESRKRANPRITEKIE